jgi:S-DNA-T family DNA segregation ATPase FtsK/SpoIIIE
MGKIKRIKHEMTGILSVSASLIVFTSLITHNPLDPSPFTHTSSKVTVVKNLLGIFGSYLSDTLLQVLGVTAYIIPLMLGVYGLRKIFGKERKHKTVVSSIATIILIFSISSLLTLIFKESSGGIVGSLTTRLSLKLLSTTGSYLLFIPLVFVTLMFLIPFSIVDFIKAAKSKTTSLTIPFMVRSKKQPQIELEESPVKSEESPVQAPYKQETLPLIYAAKIESRVVQKAKGEYELPSIEFLKDPPPFKFKPSKEEILSSSSLLEKKLQDFSVEGKVTHVSPGPVVTMFEFEPAPGIKINRVISLCDDLALTLKATSLRISPIPGRATLGIEVPNKEREDVFLKEILVSDIFRKSHSKLTLTLGKDIFGSPVIADLGRMPHLLIAGATGSGKSVCINAMVLSLLYRATPREVKMLMIDPKMLELPIYEEIPHLMLPIITTPKDASDALRKIVFEMERRYRLLAETGSRNIEAYNKKIKSAPDGEEASLPYLVVVIDELADLMLISANEVENSIARLAQMARAAGIHLILATQRPSVDVITGVIKANFSSRISFRVASKVDSRIIIDTYGAEQLLGKGDMLFITPGSRITRVHGAYVSEDEIRTVVDFIRAQGAPDYSIFDTLTSEESEEIGWFEDRDEMYQQAKDLVLSTGQASISYIQRRLKIGYNRAARIMEMMEEEGIVGPPGEAGKPREVFRRRK